MDELNNLLKKLDEQNFKHVWHLTYASNLGSIFSRNILSFKYLNERKMSANYLGSSRIRNTRPNGFENYVPTFIVPHNKFTLRRRKKAIEVNKDLCLLQIDLHQIVSEFSRKILVSNGNLANKTFDIRVAPLKEFDQVLDLNILSRIYTEQELNGQPHKSDKLNFYLMAEVLIFQWVPPRYISKVWVSSGGLCERLASRYKEFEFDTDEQYFEEHKDLSAGSKHKNFVSKSILDAETYFQQVESESQQDRSKPNDQPLVNRQIYTPSTESTSRIKEEVRFKGFRKVALKGIGVVRIVDYVGDSIIVDLGKNKLKRIHEGSSIIDTFIK